MIKIGTPYELNFESIEVAKFYKKEWLRPISLGNFQFYKWQFIDVPYQFDKDNCVIAVDENNIIGVMGVNNRKFFSHNNELYGGELTTWIVREDYRSKGIGPKMIDFLTTKYDVLIGMGISKDALPVYMRKNFKYLRAIPRYIKVLNWDSISDYAKFDSNATKLDKYINKNRQKHEYETIKIEKEHIDLIHTKFASENNLFSRSYEYLEWRYINHPMFKYHLNIIKDKNNGGYGAIVAMRIEKVNNDLKVMHILDLFGDNNDIDASIEYILDFALENKVSVIDFFGLNSEINSFFIKNGWFSTMDNDFFQFPHLFQPIELRNPATTSLIYWAKDETIYNLGKLYITKEDADFDRPVLNTKD